MYRAVSRVRCACLGFRVRLVVLWAAYLLGCDLFYLFFWYFVLVVLSDVSCLFSFPPPTELLSEIVEARRDSGAEKERGLMGGAAAR
jgi:hypothetical protein